MKISWIVAMDAFDPTLPAWTKKATHVLQFCWSSCLARTDSAQSVWLNRSATVRRENNRRKLQEFYQCSCGKAWWAWNTDRPPSDGSLFS